MDDRTEIREFLGTRRAKITPQQAGLSAYGGNRRVPGLRREEVSMLAGVSVDYYVRLDEQYTALRLALLSQKRATVIRLRNERRVDDAVLRQIHGA